MMIAVIWIAIGVTLTIALVSFVLAYIVFTEGTDNSIHLNRLENTISRLPSNEYLRNRFDELKDMQQNVNLILNQLQMKIVPDADGKKEIVDIAHFAVRVLIDAERDTWVYVTNTDQEPILFTDRYQAEQFAQPFRIKGKENNVEVVLYK